MAKDLLDTGTEGLREAVSIHKVGERRARCSDPGRPRVRVRGTAGKCGVSAHQKSPPLLLRLTPAPGPDDSISQLPLCLADFGGISNKT